MDVDTLLNQRYEIDVVASTPEAKGGMAVIYSGTDTETGKPIAAKTLLPEYQGNAHRRERFRNEGAVLRAVQGPHIVQLLDVIDDRHGSWIIMERLQGETLRQKLDRHDYISLSTISSWLTQTAQALEHMHELGYVHLDVTPRNIYIGTDGNVTLIDFGISQKADSTPRMEDGHLLGTLSYVSPEYVARQTVTPAADIYSLGCVVYDLVVNQSPADGSSTRPVEEAIRNAQQRWTDLPSMVAPERNLPVWVDSVVTRAIMPDAADRYPTVSAFAEEFRAHARPPLIRLPWARRRSARAGGTSGAQIPASAETRTVAISQPETKPVRSPSAPRRWLQKEIRNARRALVVFALLMAMVAAMPYVSGPGWMNLALGVLPGSTTVVRGNDWFIRDKPTTTSDINVMVNDGQKVRITGVPAHLEEDYEEHFWWPVSVTVDGETYNGWIRDDGLKRTWLMDRAADSVLEREWVNGRWHDVTDWLPGL